MPRNWYIKTQDGQHGPVTSKALAALAREGHLTPTTGVSCDGIKWVKARRISGLRFPQSHTKKSGRKRRLKLPAEVPNEWYVQTKNSVAGPFTLKQIKKLARRGKLLPKVAVSHDQKSWIKAKRIPGIAFEDEIIELEQPDVRTDVAVEDKGGHDVTKADDATEPDRPLPSVAEITPAAADDLPEVDRADESGEPLKLVEAESVEAESVEAESVEAKPAEAVNAATVEPALKPKASA